MKKYQLFLCLSFVVLSLHAQKTPKESSGNPIFPGWYADPEGAIFGKKYWVYPTYSAKFEAQTFICSLISKLNNKYETMYYVKN